MYYLFLDTTSKLKIGLLSKELKWIELLNIEEKKPSEVIHGHLFHLLKKNNLDLKQCLKIITCAGPGSYTGMRLSEGIVQVLELAGLETCTFFHFNMPRHQGLQKFIWIATAFKGEFFFHVADGDTHTQFLVSKDELNKTIEKFQDYPKFTLSQDMHLLS